MQLRRILGGSCIVGCRRRNLVSCRGCVCICLGGLLSARRCQVHDTLKLSKDVPIRRRYIAPRHRKYLVATIEHSFDQDATLA